ncbi:glutaredoxin-like protein NrdH [Lacticigenium naphthae]|uniref:glutaredoxin-like protein NrdH n=1 Tax=Lacticigenium naphthae TaxID=515351 RepID=UPI000429528D|nr:glutaredoxin-like protein NrdH [Lacticigenium naphthae]
MTKKIILYTKIGCGQCLFTKKQLEKMHLAFEEKNISQNPEWIDEVKALGFQSLPVISIEGEEPFSGYQPDKLEKLVM